MEGSDGGVPEGGSTDGTAPDVAAPDASVADGDLRDGHASTPCAAAHFLCEDFDRPQPWSEWTPNITPGSPIVVDTDRFVSAPQSLHVTVQPSSTQDVHPSFLARQLPAAQHVVITADVAVSRSSAPAPDGEIDVVALELVPPIGFTRYFVTIVARSDGNYILEVDVTPSANGAIQRHETLGGLTSDFTRIGFDLDLDAGTLTSSFDGKKSPPIALAQAQGMGGRLAVGAAWANNTRGTFAINVDNLVVDQ